MSDLGLDLLFRRRVTGNNNIVVSYTPDEEDRSKLWFGMAVCVCAPAALLNKGLQLPQSLHSILLSFECERVFQSTFKSATYDNAIRELSFITS